MREATALQLSKCISPCDVQSPSKIKLGKVKFIGLQLARLSAKHRGKGFDQ